MPISRRFLLNDPNVNRPGNHEFLRPPTGIFVPSLGSRDIRNYCYGVVKHERNIVVKLISLPQFCRRQFTELRRFN